MYKTAVSYITNSKYIFRYQNFSYSQRYKRVCLSKGICKNILPESAGSSWFSAELNTNLYGTTNPVSIPVEIKLKSFCKFPKMVPKRKFPMQLSSGQRTSRIILILFDFDANKRSNPTQSKSDIVLTNVGASMEKDGIWAAKSLNIPACDSTCRISMRSGKWQRKKEAIKRKKNTND